ncbi:MAG TPA: GAF domain-containing protein, partial [Solirubrobacterales bacterium]|nr:GAF domain-containing protein [Solirubrobacterales bacterium]
MGRGAKPAKVRVEAELASLRRSLKSEAARRDRLEKRLAAAEEREAATADALQARTRELAEAREQQAATGQILRVISSSPTGLQPVLGAVAENAARVCGADDAAVFRVDGEVLRLAAEHRSLPSTLGIGATVPIGRDWVAGRSVQERRTLHVEDVMAAEAEFPETVSRIRAAGYAVGTTLVSPLLREGIPLGAIAIRRIEVRPFTETQVAMLQTFADQAMIAIESARLVTELQAKNQALAETHAQVTEALDQQTATAEILRVISSSPADLQPVMDAVAESAARLCGADNVVVFRAEGSLLHPVAVHGPWPTVEVPIGRGVPSGRALLDRATIHVPDLSAVLEEYPGAGPRMEQTGSRALLVAPLLSKGEAIGTITIRRDTPG